MQFHDNMTTTAAAAGAEVERSPHLVQADFRPDVTIKVVIPTAGGEDGGLPHRRSL
jgi:hypothetical protein